MKYLLPLLIIINCHEIKGVFEWTVVGKVTDYGQNVTLFCHVPNCCPKDAGWDRWTPHQRTLFIDVKSGRSNKKYDGKVAKDGYTLIIQNLTKNDLNVSYSCLYGVTLGEQKFLLAEDVFTYISTAQPNVNSRLSEGQIAGIIVGVVVLVAVALSAGLLVFHFHRPKTKRNIGGKREHYNYEVIAQEDKAKTDNNTDEVVKKLIDKESESFKKDCFLQDPANVECMEGEDAILKCEVCPGSTPGTWWKDGIEIRHDNKSRIMSNVPSEEKIELQLVLKNVKRSDSGRYIVEVGKCSRKLLLQIKDIQQLRDREKKKDPSVWCTLSVLKVKFGETALIGCVISNCPDQYDIFWEKIQEGKIEMLHPSNSKKYKYSGSTKEYPHLIINNVEMDDAVFYRCNIKNVTSEEESLFRSNSVKVIVLDVPVVKIDSTAVHVIVGGYITISCMLLNISKVFEVVWEKIDVENINNHILIDDKEQTKMKYEIRLNPNPNITIKDAHKSDDAYYCCCVEFSSSSGDHIIRSEKTRLYVDEHKDIKLPWLLGDGAFQSMLSNGTFLSYENRLSLAGPSKAGKSTLASVLIGEEIPKEHISTDGLVIFFGRNGIDIKGEKMVPLQKGENRKQAVLSKVLFGNPNCILMSEQVTKQYTPTQIHVVQRGALTSAASTTDTQQNAEVNKHSPDQVSIQSNNKMVDSDQEPKRSNISDTLLEADDIQTFNYEEMQLKSDLLEAVKKGEYKIEIAPSDLIDFGGQKSYDMTHQLFIQHSGSFLLMFDGRNRLHDQLKGCPDGVTAASILKHWVESILTYTEETGDIMPMIMFAATHRDKCKENIANKKNEFVRDIEHIFRKHEKKNHLLMETVYFINGMDKNDTEIKKMTDQVVQFAMKQSLWGQRRPMQWVPLEIQISNMRMHKKNIITKEYLQRVNELNKDQALDKDQLIDFLLFQHSIGKLMYYNISGLDNFIIIHPPALVNILRSFVTDESFFPNDPNLKQILENLTKTGTITKSDLFKLWQQQKFNQDMAVDAIKEFVIQLLIHLDILIVPKANRLKQNSAYSHMYLVPCMIKEIRPPNFIPHKSLMERTISLRYSLIRNYIPNALAYKVIGATINAWPLKYDGQKQLCLYQKAVVVNVSERNELRVFIEDNRVMVYLTNKESIISISPDIAASIQECLTKNFEMAILFHYKSCGTNISQNKVSEKYTIEVGYPCVSEVCYKSSKAVEEIHSWTCPNSNMIEHQTKYLLYWTFNKKEKECDEQCEGLTEQELKAEPSEKHLVRLANRINVKAIEKILSNLGVEMNEWERIKNDYNSHSFIEQAYIALTRWKNAKISPTSTLKDLSDALRDVDPEKHYICQVFRETVEELDFASINIKDVPGDELLEGLSTQIGNCPMQLGIELGLSLADFDNMRFCQKDLPGLIKDILLEWRKRSNDKTFHSLVMALQQVNSRGIRYLTELK